MEPVATSENERDFFRAKLIQHEGSRRKARAKGMMLSLQSRAEGAPPELCASPHGFSLHTAMRCGAHQSKELPRPCTYITRPAIANERLQRHCSDQVVFQLKSAYQDAGCQAARSLKKHRETG
jgi:Putative transposase